VRILRTKAEIRQAIAEARARGPVPATHASPSDATGRTVAARPLRVALVPTMGYLHEGHLTLVDRARELADLVVLSIFVNPLQFGPGEDLDRYPRDLDRDVALAAARGVDLVFAPDATEVYPGGDPAVQIVPLRLADRLCGAFRPGHFQGVLTIVAKLFLIVGPDVAIFGQKDYQQAVLVRRMVEDLDLPVRIEVAPIVREPDGLAMSSRNVYLDPEERERARAIPRGLDLAVRAFRAGETDPRRLVEIVRDELAAVPGIRPQYVELVHPDSLEPVDVANPGAVLAVAAFVGGTRLIDNVILR
jgi:pantoate--beta-alanine ligase